MGTQSKKSYLDLKSGLNNGPRPIKSSQRSHYSTCTYFGATSTYCMSPPDPQVCKSRPLESSADGVAIWGASTTPSPSRQGCVKFGYCAHPVTDYIRGRIKVYMVVALSRGTPI